MSGYIVLSHNGDIDGAAEWTIYQDRDVALAIAERRAKEWKYTAVRPVGDIIQGESR